MSALLKDSSSSIDLLLLELKDGNSKVFRLLFDLYWESMFLNAKSIVGNENNAKDIVQEIWIRIWQKRDNLDIRNLDAYLFRAVRNASFKFLRDHRFSKLQLEIIENLKLSVEPEIRKQHDFEARMSAIRNILDKLPSRCAQIFELSRFKQYSNEEIAQELGISKKSVENQISTAIKYLKHSLASFLSFIIALSVG